MINKIHYIYIKICLFILKNIDRRKKLIGCPNKFECVFYIMHIININITITGLSWDKLGLLLLINNVDLIRKKYIKWIHLGIFSKVNNIILNQLIYDSLAS
jgi:hypothetical protein